MKKTFLFSQHEELKAKLVDFYGWALPLHYPTGALEEHRKVRESAGLFDISHMGQVLIDGKEVEPFLESIATNRIGDMEENQIRYSVLVDEKGISIDDVLIYRLKKEQFACIVNGANRQKDVDFLQKQAQTFDVTVKPNFEGRGIIALQGPNSLKVLEGAFEKLQEMKIMRGAFFMYEGQEIYISRTGYTGELGFEIYGPEKPLKSLWKSCLHSKKASVKPIGLAARDSLRLEMGYVLYGQDLSADIFANESLARWTIKWKKDFLGKKALEIQEKNPQKRKAYGVTLKSPLIARSGMQVFVNGEKRGQVTSGGFSPMLKQPIALLLVQGQIEPTDEIRIEIRQKLIEAQLTSLPFYKK